MGFKIDIKLALTLAALIAGLGGFYYTTQMRLDSLEGSSSDSSLSEEVSSLKKQVNRLSKRVKKLEEK
jgi:uncharacterized protein YlxW (UPF0749 family)